LCRTDDALLLYKTDGILRRLGILASFNFDKDQHIAFPRDHVDFATVGTVAGCHDSISERAKVIDGENLGATAKTENSVEE